MSARTFDNLLKQISPCITSKNTHTDPVSAAEPLAVTLHFLVTSSSYRTPSVSYKLRITTVTQTVNAICNAIWAVMKDVVVAFPNEDQWEKKI